ncbi:hypothetical protein Clacol_002275 [Clathrus columnatus]|uniref:Uncharacterized protein n=1 Tax=Clathrus columnatus TaxID=1419009 RepID=A0AAV5A5Y3_9AGAM|nr:hypothetical protein Clacol_002275 [Clathrus columnatus]
MPSTEFSGTVFCSNYHLKVPFATSIYSRPTREQTLSALIDVNISLPVHNKLPRETLLLVNDEVHANPEYEDIRSTWTPVMNVSEYVHFDMGGLRLDVNTDSYTFLILEGPPSGKSGLHQHRLKHSISSADTLYRLRCLFPEVVVKSYGPDGYKQVWQVELQHNQSGIMLHFYEYKGGATLSMSMAYDDLESTGGGVDFSNGINLTRIISSSLLFYRLLCHYAWPYNNVNKTPPITSVWQANPEYEEIHLTWTPVTSVPDYEYLYMDDELRLEVNRDLYIFRWSDERKRGVHRHDLDESMSSTDMLYRLRCLSPEVIVESYGVDERPQVWQVSLQHNQSGIVLQFSDQEGGAQLMTGWMDGS